jgi:hypothetical protein
MLRSVRHDAIIQLKDVVSTPNSPALILQFALGGDL